MAIVEVESAVKVADRYRVWVIVAENDDHSTFSRKWLWKSGDSDFLWDDKSGAQKLDTSLTSKLDEAIAKADLDETKAKLDDMPARSDARRVIRLAMMMDEVRRIAKAYVTNSLDKIRDHISDDEFFACGGMKQTGKQYSLYRQLVYAKRDVEAYSSRMCFPSGKAVKSAIDTYEFYPSDNEDVALLDDATSKTSRKDINRMHRIAFVLKRFRRFMRTHQTLASSDAQGSFLKIKLTKDHFVQCGGHKTVSKKLMFSFYRQIVLAKRDMEDIMRKGRFNKSKSLAPSGYISSDAESEEDVDGFDMDDIIALTGECMNTGDEVDDLLADADEDEANDGDSDSSAELVD